MVESSYCKSKFITYCFVLLYSLIDMFEKKSREGSAEPGAVSTRARPAEPYNASDDEEEDEGEDSHAESDNEKTLAKNEEYEVGQEEDDDDDDDDEIV